MSTNVEEQYAQLEFTDDFLFCKILEGNPDLCKELLEVILGVKIRKVERVSKQKEIRVKSDGKGVRFDVYLEDADNTVFDIEMQTTTKKDLPRRARYYQGMIDMDLIQKRAKYKDLKKSYVIFICLSDPFDRNLSVYHFENRCEEDKDLLLGDEALKVFLNANGIRENISDELKAFLDYLKDKRSCSHLTERLQKEVEQARLQEEWRNEFVFLEERYQEKFEEGLEAGLIEGREAGLIEGREAEIFSSVQEGDYSAERAAEKLGITVEEFRERMEAAGYKIPESV